MLEFGFPDGRLSILLIPVPLPIFALSFPCHDAHLETIVKGAVEWRPWGQPPQREDEVASTGGALRRCNAGATSPRAQRAEEKEHHRTAWSPARHHAGDGVATGRTLGFKVTEAGGAGDPNRRGGEDAADGEEHEEELSGVD